MASTLESCSFIQARRRFLARRGPVREIRSDNDTNFGGARKELFQAIDEMDHKEIEVKLQKENIDWVFNPPTLMCEVEAIINSRPLTTVSGEPDDLEPLTPNHILTTKSTVVLPPPGNFHKNDVFMRRRWRRVQYLVNLFWSQWKKEYLVLM